MLVIKMSELIELLFRALQDTINQVGKSIDALNQEMSHLSLIQGEVEKFAAQRLPGFYETFKRNIPYVILF
jgi:hypothetical protein